jgi:hypothetical protein
MITQLLASSFDISPLVFQWLMEYWNLPELISVHLDKTEKLTLFKEAIRILLTILSSVGSEFARRALQPALGFFLPCMADPVVDTLLFSNERLLLHLVGDEFHNALAVSAQQVQVQVLQRLGDSFCRYLRREGSDGDAAGVEAAAAAAGEEGALALDVALDVGRSGAEQGQMLARVLHRLTCLLLTVVMASITTAAAPAPCTHPHRHQQKQHQHPLDASPPRKRGRGGGGGGGGGGGESTGTSTSTPPLLLQRAAGSLALLHRLLDLLQPACSSSSSPRPAPPAARSWCLEAMTPAPPQHSPALEDCIFTPTSALLASPAQRPGQQQKHKQAAVTSPSDHAARLCCLSSGLDILALLFSSSGKGGQGEEEGGRRPGVSSSHPHISRICSVVDLLQQTYSCLHLAATQHQLQHQHQHQHQLQHQHQHQQFCLKVKYLILLHMEHYARRFPVHFFHHARLSRNDGGGGELTNTNSLADYGGVAAPGAAGGEQHFSPNARLTLLHALIDDVTLHSVRGAWQDQPCGGNKGGDANQELSRWRQGFGALAFDLLLHLLRATPRYDDDVLHSVEQRLFLSSSCPLSESLQGSSSSSRLGGEAIGLVGGGGGGECSEKMFSLHPVCVNSEVHCLQLLLFVLNKECESPSSAQGGAVAGTSRGGKSSASRSSSSKAPQRRSPYFNVPCREKKLTNQVGQYTTRMTMMVAEWAADREKGAVGSRREIFNDLTELVTVTIDVITSALLLFSPPDVASAAHENRGGTQDRDSDRERESRGRNSKERQRPDQQALVSLGASLVRLTVQTMGSLSAPAASASASAPASASSEVEAEVEAVGGAGQALARQLRSTLSFLLLAHRLQQPASSSQHHSSAATALPAPQHCRVFYHNLASLLFDAQSLLALRRALQRSNLLGTNHDNYRDILSFVLKQETTQAAKYRRQVGSLVSTTLLRGPSAAASTDGAAPGRTRCCCDLLLTAGSALAARIEQRQHALVSSMLLFFQIIVVLTLPAAINDEEEEQGTSSQHWERRVSDVLVNKVVTEHVVRDWVQFERDVAAAASGAMPADTSAPISLFYDVSVFLMACLLFRGGHRGKDQGGATEHADKSSLADDFFRYSLTGSVCSEAARAIASRLSEAPSAATAFAGAGGSRAGEGAMGMGVCYSVSGVSLALSMLPDPLVYLPDVLCSSSSSQSTTSRPSCGAKSLSGRGPEVEMGGGPLWACIVCCHPCCQTPLQQTTHTKDRVAQKKAASELLPLLVLRHPVISTWRCLLLLHTAAAAASAVAGRGAHTLVFGSHRVDDRAADLRGDSNPSVSLHPTTSAVGSEAGTAPLLDYLASLTTFTNCSSAAPTVLCVHAVWEMVALLWQNQSMQGVLLDRALSLQMINTLHSINNLLPHLVFTVISASVASASTSTASHQPFIRTRAYSGCAVGDGLCVADILDTVEGLVSALLFACRALVHSWPAGAIREILEVVRTVLFLVSSPSFVAVAYASPSRRNTSSSFSSTSSSYPAEDCIITGENGGKRPSSKGWVPKARAIACSLLSSMELVHPSESVALPQDSSGAAGTGTGTGPVVIRLLLASLEVLEVLADSLASADSAREDAAADTEAGDLCCLLQQGHLAIGERLLSFHSPKLKNKPHLHLSPSVSPSSSLQRWASLSSSLQQLHHPASSAAPPSPAEEVRQGEGELLHRMSRVLLTAMCAEEAERRQHCGAAGGARLHKEGEGGLRRGLPPSDEAFMQLTVAKMSTFLQCSVYHYPFRSESLTSEGGTDGGIGGVDKAVSFVETVISLASTSEWLLAAAQEEANGGGSNVDVQSGEEPEWLLSAQCQCGDLFITLSSDTAVIDALPILGDLWKQQQHQQQQRGEGGGGHGARSSEDARVWTEVVLWKLLLLRFATLCLVLLYTCVPSTPCSNSRSSSDWREVLLAPETHRWTRWLRDVGVLLPPRPLPPPPAPAPLPPVPASLPGAAVGLFCFDGTSSASVRANAGRGRSQQQPKANPMHPDPKGIVLLGM